MSIQRRTCDNMKIFVDLCNIVRVEDKKLPSRSRAVLGTALVSLILFATALVFNTAATITSFSTTRKTQSATPKFVSEDNKTFGITLHKELVGRDELLSTLLLCRPRDQYDITKLSWTTARCFDEDNETLNPHVRSVASLMAEESTWASCAAQVNQSALHIGSLKNDTFKPLCSASYAEPRSGEHALLKVPIHDFDPNVFHMMVIRGHPFWCVLDAVTRFAAQTKNSTWTVEYEVESGTEKRGSNYVEQLFRSLSNDNDVKENSETSYELSQELPFWKDVQLVSTNGIFRPNTQFSEWLANTAARVRYQIALSDAGIRFEKPKVPFVLLVLRSTKRRRLAGAQTGTATEIVLALLERSMPVYVVDLAKASIEEQILLFESAPVVIGMHGAGLTNMIWMRPKESTIIEVAASYGWARYVDNEGRCSIVQNEPEAYMKGGYSNLASRFGIQHELFQPVYASRPWNFPSNPAGKTVYYVDADALAITAERAFTAYSQTK